MTNSKPFCYAPWTNIQYSGVYEGGGTSVCCEWRGGKYTGDVKDYESSEYLQNIKQAMVDNNMDVISNACGECLQAEKAGGMSQRNYIEQKSTKYNNFDKIWRLDYRPDNLCNLKCRMCSPYSSSLIEEEYVKHGQLEDFIPKRNTDDLVDFDMSALEEFAILGGEPTFNKKLYSILDYVTLNPNVRLSYTTNATTFPKQWKERIKKFKNVHVNLSIDATGDTYEYIRSNAQWKVVEKNIPTIIEHSDSFSFRPVLMIYNVFTIEKWIEYFFQFPEDSVHFSPVYGEIPLGLELIPEDIRQTKIEALVNLNHPIADKAAKIIKSFSYSDTKLNNFIRKTEFQDRIRNTNVFELSSDFRTMWNNYNDKNI